MKTNINIISLLFQASLIITITLGCHFSKECKLDCPTILNIDLSTKDSSEINIPIKNLSNHSVSIDNISTTCNCLHVGTTGFQIKSGETFFLPVRVFKTQEAPDTVITERICLRTRCDTVFRFVELSLKCK